MTEAVPTDDKLVSLPEFAAAAGYKRTFAYQLHKEGRLVPEAEGSKRVWLQASLQRVAATRDPSKAGVAARHAANRAAKEEPPLDADLPAEGEGADPEADVVGLFNYQSAKAKREHFAALREENEYRKEAGQLIEVAQASAAFADAGATLGAGLEAMAATLAPQLVGLDEVGVRNALQDYADQLRGELAAKIGAAAKDWGAHA